MTTPSSPSSPSSLLVQPPERIPVLLRPGLFVARKMTGKDPLPARLLAHFPKGAVGAGIFEACAASGADLDGDGDHHDGARILAVVRIVSSAVGGCPFCIDMNAATWQRTGLSAEGLAGLLRLDDDVIAGLDSRTATAARYAVALTKTPTVVDDDLAGAMRRQFSEREIVVLACTIAQVGFWSRFESVCALPTSGDVIKA
jgi:AhpD family alkylhydroperoxidase